MTTIFETSPAYLQRAIPLVIVRQCGSGYRREEDYPVVYRSRPPVARRRGYSCSTTLRNLRCIYVRSDEAPFLE